MMRLLMGLVLGMVAAAGGAQGGAATAFDKITFGFERVELTPPRWGFEIGSDGAGRYYQKSTGSEENAWQDVKVSPATLAILRGGAERRGQACETKAKHIAQTGKKVLTYWHGDTPFACTFNYSDDAAVMKVADAFQAMAATLQYGERLQQKHRFDRLGLDAEVDSLAGAVKQGEAMEVQNIAPALQSIVDDERVMERVRRKAARVLEGSGTGRP